MSAIPEPTSSWLAKFSGWAAAARDEGQCESVAQPASKALRSTLACLPLAINADTDAERDQEDQPPAVPAPPDHGKEDRSGHPSPADPPPLFAHSMDSRCQGPTLTDRLLTAREVGELVGLSTETILRRWRRGEILGFRLATNVLRFDPVEVHAWVESCRAVASVRSEAHTAASVSEPRMNVPRALREWPRPGGRRLNRRTPGLSAARSLDAC